MCISFLLASLLLETEDRSFLQTFILHQYTSCQNQNLSWWWCPATTHTFLSVFSANLYQIFPSCIKLLTASADLCVCVCVLLTGCTDAECPATLFNRQQHKLVHMATPGACAQQRSSYTVPHRQRCYHSNHQPLSSPTLHWNPGPPETHTAETHGSSLLETDGQKESKGRCEFNDAAYDVGMDNFLPRCLAAFHPLGGTVGILGHVMYDLFSPWQLLAQLS